jgi:hypothetical protein
LQCAPIVLAGPSLSALPNGAGKCRHSQPRQAVENKGNRKAHIFVFQADKKPGTAFPQRFFIASGGRK